MSFRNENWKKKKTLKQKAKTIENEIFNNTAEPSLPSAMPYCE